VSLQVGDKVEAWNNEEIAEIAATVTKDNRNGTYAVEYEGPTRTDDGKPTWGACPESYILDYKESDATHRRNFRGRGKGTRTTSLQDRLTVHDDPAAAMIELLRWSQEDMGGDTKRVKALVTITPDLALEGMRAAVRAAGGGDAVGLAFPCRNVGAGNMDAVDADRGMTCLHEVALPASGNVAVASLLLANNANVDAQERKGGKTSLYMAVERGHSDLARLLIRNGADVNIGDGKGWTPLIRAAYEGRADMVALLVNEGKADVDLANNIGSTPLYISAGRGYTEIVKFLVTEGKAEVDKSDNDGRTPLNTAAEQGRTEVVKFLIMEGKAAVDKAMNDGCTSLSMAAFFGKTEVVKVLVTEGKAAVDKVANDGATPLINAAQEGFTEIVKFLVTEGKAEVDKARHNGDTPLIIAVSQRRIKIDVVRLLLEAKADVTVKGEGGLTALYWAKTMGHQAIVALLEGREPTPDSLENLTQSLSNLDMGGGGSEVEFEKAGLSMVAIRKAAGGASAGGGGLNVPEIKKVLQANGKPITANSAGLRAILKSILPDE
jgi:ankyrin repeat protein